jgi:hypothetical protein
MAEELDPFQEDHGKEKWNSTISYAVCEVELLTPQLQYLFRVLYSVEA